MCVVVRVPSREEQLLPQELAASPSTGKAATLCPEPGRPQGPAVSREVFGPVLLPGHSAVQRSLRIHPGTGCTAALDRCRHGAATLCPCPDWAAAPTFRSPFTPQDKRSQEWDRACGTLTAPAARGLSSSPSSPERLLGCRVIFRATKGGKSPSLQLMESAEVLFPSPQPADVPSPPPQPGRRSRTFLMSLGDLVSPVSCQRREDSGQGAPRTLCSD